MVILHLSNRCCLTIIILLGKVTLCVQFVGTSARADTTVSSTAEVVLPDDSAVMEPDAVDLSAVVDMVERANDARDRSTLEDRFEKLAKDVEKLNEEQGCKVKLCEKNGNLLDHEKPLSTDFDGTFHYKCGGRFGCKANTTPQVLQFGIEPSH